jgi:hypothetical protein
LKGSTEGIENFKGCGGNLRADAVSRNQCGRNKGLGCAHLDLRTVGKECKNEYGAGSSRVGFMMSSYLFGKDAMGGLISAYSRPGGAVTLLMSQGRYQTAAAAR